MVNKPQMPAIRELAKFLFGWNTVSLREKFQEASKYVRNLLNVDEDWK